MLISDPKKKIILIVVVLAIIAAVVFGLYQIAVLRKAHSSFENYYAFRGCVRLFNRTSEYGVCQTRTGQVIKIVKFRNRWYLDGDLPTCWHNFCF